MIKKSTLPCRKLWLPNSRLLCVTAGLVACLLVMSVPSFAARNTKVFISFSMPSELVNQVLSEAELLSVPVVINGLINDSMRETASKLFELSKSHKNLNMQIDPTAFEQYNIQSVPAVVVAVGDKFDVLYGNLSIHAALDEINAKGQTGRRK